MERADRNTTSSARTLRRHVDDTSRSILRYVEQHWRMLLRITTALLIVIVVLQNVESTSIDLLFWSVPGVPKVVLLLVAMAVGAAVWELGRRIARRRLASPPPEHESFRPGPNLFGRPAEDQPRGSSARQQA